MKRCEEGMGAHFHKHAVERGLNPASQSDGRDYGVLPTDYCGRCGAWLARQPGQTEQTGGRYSEQVDDDGGMNLREEVRRGTGQ